MVGFFAAQKNLPYANIKRNYCMDQNTLKKQAAEAAIEFVEQDSIVGVGTGSTVNFFIEALIKIKSKIDGAVASSLESQKLLKDAGIHVFD